MILQLAQPMGHTMQGNQVIKSLILFRTKTKFTNQALPWIIEPKQKTGITMCALTRQNPQQQHGL